MKTRISPPGSANLFPNAQPAGPPAGVHTANIDGASRGNPGPAAYAVVLRDPDGKVVLELGKKIGRETNNVAEYYALLAALDYAMNQGIGALRIRSDSELLVRQMQGRYKVKSPDLKPLYERALKIARQLPYFAIEHVRREYNADADALANVALDSGNVSNAAKIVAEAPQTKSETRLAASEAESNTRLPAARAERTVATAAAAAPAAPAERHPAIAAPRSYSRINVRARVVKGVLVPMRPIELPDGAEVEVDLLVPRENEPAKE